MTDKQVFHPLFGRSVKNGATDTCSRCAHTIPEEAVPLLLWDNEDKSIMWCLCANCEKPILSAALVKGPQT